MVNFTSRLPKKPTYQVREEKAPLPIHYAPLFMDLRPESAGLIPADKDALNAQIGEIVFLNPYTITGGRDVGNIQLALQEAVDRMPPACRERLGAQFSCRATAQAVKQLIDKNQHSPAGAPDAGYLFTRAMEILTKNNPQTGELAYEDNLSRVKDARDGINKFIEQMPLELLTLAKHANVQIVVIPNADENPEVKVGEKGAAFNIMRRTLFMSEHLLEKPHGADVLNEEFLHMGDALLCELNSELGLKCYFTNEPEFRKAATDFLNSNTGAYIEVEAARDRRLPKADLDSYEPIAHAMELLVNFFHVRNQLVMEENSGKKEKFNSPEQTVAEKLDDLFGEELCALCSEYIQHITQTAAMLEEKQGVAPGKTERVR